MSAHMFIDCFQCKRCSFCVLAVQVAVRLSDGNHEVLPYWFFCVGCVATPRRGACLPLVWNLTRSGQHTWQSSVAATVAAANC
jgi:hypothetical protein